MCGIVGRINPEPSDPRTFDAMVDALRARGPDGRGVHVEADGRVRLGHRRLAIIGLGETGRQPMTNEDGSLWLTYNGEIYNHVDLRRELSDAGHHLESRCDAEVIVHGYEQWGEAVVERLRGIFAFGIWDRRRRRLFLARDHVGVKPLYYRADERSIAFASQCRSLVADPAFRDRPRPESLIDYLSYGVVSGDRSIWQGIEKLPPATTLTWNADDGSIRRRRYWDVRPEPVIDDFDTAVAATRDQIRESVSMQLMSEVPVGTYLSGGIDSSVITAVARAESDSLACALTIGFEETESDERPYAEAVVRHCGLDHHVATLRRDESLTMFDELFDTFDEPYGLGASIPMMRVARLTARHGMKVVLAGDGADELFAGYRHYDDFERLYRRYGLGPSRSAGGPNAPSSSVTPGGSLRMFGRRWVDRLRGRFDEPLAHFFPREGVISGRDQRRFLGQALRAWKRHDRLGRLRAAYDPGLPAVAAGQQIDFHTFLVDEILAKVDRSTMAYGVEARVPFLDPKLVELAFSIAPEVQYRHGRKSVLKAAAAAWLPPEILTPRKKGFSIPVSAWLRADGQRDRMIETLAGGYLVQNDYLNADGLRQFLRRSHPSRTWQLYVAEGWCRRWCGSTETPATFGNQADHSLADHSLADHSLADGGTATTASVVTASERRAA